MLHKAQSCNCQRDKTADLELIHLRLRIRLHDPNQDSGGKCDTHDDKQTQIVGAVDVAGKGLRFWMFRDVLCKGLSNRKRIIFMTHELSRLAAGTS